MKCITRRHACIALLAACVSANALSQEAKWAPYSASNYFKEGDGAYLGPGVATARFSTCAITMNLLENEVLHVEPTSGSLLFSYLYSNKGYRANYWLSCYTGERLKKIRAVFTAPDGSLGLSAHKLERRQEYPEANVSAVYFNGKNWQGIGITEDSRNMDDPIQNMNFCVFGEQQALCSFEATVKHLENPRDDMLDTILNQLRRIEFIDPDK